MRHFRYFDPKSGRSVTVSVSDDETLYAAGYDLAEDALIPEPSVPIEQFFRHRPAKPHGRGLVDYICKTLLVEYLACLPVSEAEEETLP